jgi:hypothetical protein
VGDEHRVLVSDLEPQAVSLERGDASFDVVE